MNIDPDLLEIVAGFVPEATEICDKISRDVLELEDKAGAAAPSASTYKGLARGLHTLKGTSATLGLDDLSTVAHAMEDVVVPLHRDVIRIPSAVADKLLRTLDVFRERLQAHACGRSGELPDPGLAIDRLRRTSATPSAAPKPPAPEDAGAVLIGVPPQIRVEPVSVAIEAARPATPEETQAVEENGSWRVKGRDVIALLRQVERMREMRLRMAERRRMTDATLATVSKLARIPETAAVYADLANISRALKADGDEIGEMVESLEEGVKTICTLPVQTIVEPLYRAVRDLCRSIGKEANLSVVGAELSIDRRILEGLKGPLVHLIRNAIDHGIEPPNARSARGKHRSGALVIRVEQQGNMVFVEVADDGAGVDCDRIREIALKRGLFTSDDLVRMTRAQAMRIIFQPGFSTRAEVSGTSGRGVGMDVVLSEVQALGGTVDVQSTPGEGSRFVLMLPADLGSCPILIVRCGDHPFGLAVANVEAIVAARRDRLRIDAETLRLEHGDDLLPMRDLGALMGLREGEVPPNGQPILIVQAQGRRVALGVDEVIGDREHVIQPLPNDLGAVAPAYQGACIQGQGELLLVLRSDWIVASLHDAPTHARTSSRALVVDDSLTARAMHRAVLEAGGYTVHAVGSARSALEQLGHSAYDVIVCDVAMEPVDGIALMKQLRTRPDTSTLPIMLVSMSDSDEERARGLAAGADGFLSKKDCASGRLLAEITSVVSRRRALSP